MISKNFDLKTFKAKAAHASDFLKSKGHEIPKNTLLNSLSVFLGEKNWNTLQAKLKENKNEATKNLQGTQTILELKENSSEFVDITKNMKFLNYTYDIETLLSLTQQLGFINIKNDDLLNCINILNHTSNLIENKNKEICVYGYSVKAYDFIQNIDDYFKDINIYHSRLIEHNDTYSTAKRPYVSLIQNLIQSFRLIGDEDLVATEFFLQSEDDDSFNLFFSTFMMIMFTNMSGFKSGFQPLILVKFRCRGKKIRVSLYSFLDNSENRKQDIFYGRCKSECLLINEDFSFKIRERSCSIIDSDIVQNITMN